MHTPNEASLENDERERGGGQIPEWKISRAATGNQRPMSLVRGSAEVNNKIRTGQECRIYALSGIQRGVMDDFLLR